MKKPKKLVEKTGSYYINYLGQDRWGNSYITLKTNKGLKTYPFDSEIKGRHKIRIYNPNINDKRLSFKAQLV